MKLDQVARRARVSTATVSRVLNNTGLVKTATRARVPKAIKVLKNGARRASLDASLRDRSSRRQETL